MALTSGIELGPYEILSPLGAGGMGEVYRARDNRLKRDVALKLLPAEYAADPERVRRFEQEAHACAALNHPNILAIHDIGSRAEAFYMVTELLEGETLRHRLNGGALPTRKAIEYSVQIAEGLAAAHEKGIIHRDLKPENIFVTRDGRVKILDFGLAKLAPAVPLDDRTLGSDGVETDAGLVLGTLGYMSPEQVRGSSIDHRSDLFSFGAVLYEMLSGRRAFRGSTPADTISAILKEDPPELSTTGREVSPALERIVRHCLEKNPEERFQSARDLAFDLESISGSNSQSPAVAVARRRVVHTSLRIAAIASLALAVLAAIFWAGWSLKPATSASFKQLTFRRGTVTTARFAPDGQNIIYSAAWEGSLHPELFSARTDGVLSRPLDVNDADLLAISPQGEMALLQHWRRTRGYERRGTLARMALSGGAPKEMLDGVQAADWSSDGATLAVIRSDPNYQLEFPIGHVLVSATTGWLSDVRVARDQEHVAFFEHPQRSDDRGSVCIVDLRGNKRVLSTGWSSLEGLAWSPSGSEVWFAGSSTGDRRSLYAVSVSGRLRTLLSVPGSVLLHDVAPDGRVLLAEENQHSVVMGLTPGSAQERDLGWLDYSQVRDLTPDGRWLLLDEQGDGGGPNYSIYIRKTDGSPAVRLGDNDAFSISADGKWVLATTNASGGAVVLLPTGVGETRPIKTGNLQNPRAHFLPDGKRISLVSAGRMYVQSLDSDSPRPMTPPGVRLTRWGLVTADGKHALGRDEHQQWALYPIEGGQPIPLPKWAPGDLPVQHTSDSHSFFVRNGDLPVNIYRFDFIKGSRQFVRQLRPSDPTGMESLSAVLMTPDGKYYVYRGRRTINNLYVAAGLK